MELGKPNLDVFAETLLELGQQEPNLLIVTGDSRGSAKLATFCQTLPRQVVEVGIAEQNLVGISAGLTAAGKKVFAVSPACFLTARGLEQIKNDVAYSDVPVKLIGISAGVSYGALGTTHHSLHDFAVLLAIHNIDIVVPADNFETREAIKAALNHPRPIYIRLDKKPVYHLHHPDTVFQIGKAIVLSRGSDVTFIATGETVAPAVMAARVLAERGISSGVMSVHTLCPLDEETVLEAASTSRAIVTVEEHSVNGGLGSRVASVLLEKGIFVPFKIVAFPVEYMVTGSQSEIFAHYNITPQGLAETAARLLRFKQEIK